MKGKSSIAGIILAGLVSLVLVASAVFMENFKNMWLRGDRIYFPFGPDRPLPMISSKDIGEFAAIAFDKRDENVGQTLLIAADISTPQEIAKTFTEVLERPIRFDQQPIAEVRQFSEPLALMFERLNENASHQGISAADLNALRQKNPDLWSLKDWLRHSFKAHDNATK